MENIFLILLPLQVKTPENIFRALDTYRVLQQVFKIWAFQTSLWTSTVGVIEIGMKQGFPCMKAYKPGEKIAPATVPSEQWSFFVS